MFYLSLSGQFPRFFPQAFTLNLVFQSCSVGAVTVPGLVEGRPLWEEVVKLVWKEGDEFWGSENRLYH